MRHVDRIVVLQLCSEREHKQTTTGHRAVEGQVLDSQVDTFSAYSYVKMMFNDFCETTGLHGWKYLTKVFITSSDLLKI